MVTSTPPTPAGNGTAASESVRSQIRGSALLVTGRFVSLGINLLVQVITVRYLAREQYGMFAYALAVVDMLTIVALLGMDGTLSRFAAMYYEQSDLPRLFGAIAISAICVTGASLLLIAGTLGASNALPSLLGAEPESVRLLLVMVAMAPLQGFDTALHALYGVFGTASAIAIRKHVLGPGLKLASVLFVVAIGGTTFELALAYVLSLALGVVFYAVLLVRLLERDGVLARWQPRRIELPTRPMLLYAASLLGSQLVFLYYNSFVTMILEYFHGPNDVAGFRAVRPFARLIEFALTPFAVLFIPGLARYFGRGDQRGIEHLYVRNSVFITVLTFPVFAVTYGLADEMTVRALGKNYADSGGLLAWMALGSFVSTVFANNSSALRVLGLVRSAVVADALTLLVAAAASMWWIPVGGASGAAATVALVVSLKGILCWISLYRSTGLHPLKEGLGGVYAVVALGTALLIAARPFVAGSLVASGTLSVGVALAVLAYARRRIHLLETFPELARVPLLGRLLAEASTPGASAAAGGPP